MYSTTQDFVTYSEAKEYYFPGYPVIDATFWHVRLKCSLLLDLFLLSYQWRATVKPLRVGAAGLPLLAPSLAFSSLHLSLSCPFITSRSASVDRELPLSTSYADCWIDTDPSKCQALVSAGQWYGKSEWLVPGCTTINYHGKQIKQCAGKEKRTFAFIGDLHVQRLYFQFARRLKYDLEVPHDRRQDLHISKDNVDVQYFYDPYLNGTAVTNGIADHGQDGDSPFLVVLGAGNTHAEQDMAEQYAATIGRLASTSQVSHAGRDFMHDQEPLVLFAPAEESYSDDSTQDGRYRQLNSRMESLSDASILWSFRDMVSGRKDLYKAEGPRVANTVIQKRVDLLLNLRCNAKVGSETKGINKAICCGTWRGPNWVQITFLLLGLAILPLATIADFKLQILSDAARPVLRAFCAFTAAVSFSWIADRTRTFEQATRLALVKSNLFLMIVITFFTGLVTVRKSAINAKSGAPQPFLPRDQTDEWKGWMQALIIIYHYNKAWTFLQFWEIIRLSVASYLFLTGFGHTMYFLQKKDYSLKRFCNVMIRTNLLPVTLAYVMRTSWFLYYYMPLSTFNFVVVYATLAVGRRYNEYTLFLLAKITTAAVLLNAFLSTKDLARTVVRFFELTCKLEFNSDEFFGHRVEQDKYIVFVGMVAGMLYIYVRSTVERHERNDKVSQALRKAWPVLQPFSVATAALGQALFWYWSSKFIVDQKHWTKLQPYLTPLPVLSFTILRNAHPMLRNWYSAAFAWLGRYSLEMYVLQDHLWLANDQEAVLRTGLFHGNETFLGDRWRDVVLLTPLYLIVCSVIGDATGVITDWFIKEEPPSERTSAPTAGPMDEVEMGLLANEGTDAVDDRSTSEKAGNVPTNWISGNSKMMPRRFWPRKLKHKVFLTLGIMWTLNMGPAASWFQKPDKRAFSHISLTTAIMKTLALLITLGLAGAAPVATNEGDDVTLSVLSHDNFVSETPCSLSSGGIDKTKPCLSTIIKNLTQDFLYQEISSSGVKLDDKRRSTNRAQSTEVRAAQATDLSGTLQQRSAISGAGGFVGNFYWHSLSSSQAHDKFNKSPANIESIASTLSDYVLEYNATEICVDFGTNNKFGSGLLANGVMTFGWGREPFYYADPTLLVRRLRDDCQIGNMRMYATHYREVDLV
ncbi:putative O-acetyltransferase CAS1 [Cercospora zeina]